MKTTIYNKYLYSYRDIPKLFGTDAHPEIFRMNDTALYNAFVIALGQFNQELFNEVELCSAQEVPIVANFLRRYIIKFHDAVIFESDNGKYTNGSDYRTINPDDASAIDYFNTQWLSIFLKTKERYIVLINAYAENKTKLLEEVKTITESRFHDTPQNEGYFGDLAHTTNINQVTSKSQVDTLMNRIKEIERGYSDVIDDWCSEFKNLFIEY